MFIIVSPFVSTPIISTPRTTPQSLPFPPDILVPPSTTAVITSISDPSPVAGNPPPSLPARMIAANPFKNPAITYTVMRILSTLIPDHFAACAFPPHE